jgi:hypothetical protein
VLRHDAVELVRLVRARAEAGLVHDDERRLAPPDFLQVDAPARERVAAEVRHEDVARGDEFQEHGRALGRAHVERDPALQRLVLGLPHARAPGRDEVQLVEEAVRVDLDHGGAERRQDAAGDRQRDERPELHHAHAVQRPRPRGGCG